VLRIKHCAIRSALNGLAFRVKSLELNKAL
jgi:hypothetical protein